MQSCLAIVVLSLMFFFSPGYDCMTVPYNSREDCESEGGKCHPGNHCNSPIPPRGNCGPETVCCVLFVCGTTEEHIIDINP